MLLISHGVMRFLSNDDKSSGLDSFKPVAYNHHDYLAQRYIRTIATLPKDNNMSISRKIPKSVFAQISRPTLIPRHPTTATAKLSTPPIATMTTKAIVYVEKGKAAIQDVPIPKLRDDYVLVKVNAVGLNPTDWKHIDYGNTDPGTRSGCDYAGIVEAVGHKVQKAFKKGDRITGVVHGRSVHHCTEFLLLRLVV